MPYDLNAARRAIFAECRKQQICEDDRHAIIREIGKVASGSAADMSADAARRVLDHLRRLAGAPNEWSFIDKAAEENRPLLRKICALCLSLGAGKAYAEGVAKRQHSVDRKLEMMSASELHAVAGALSRTQKFKS